MRTVSTTILFFVMLMLTAGGASAAAEPKHAKLITQYEGTKTCLACHEDSAKDVVRSLHYQQAAEPLFLKDWEKGKVAGMMASY